MSPANTIGARIPQRVLVFTGISPGQFQVER
jgi:hypothetical protein